MNYTGYIGHNSHYGELLIGEHLGRNHYNFYVPPVSKIDCDYHTDIKRYSSKDLLLEGILDLNINDDNETIDDIKITEFIGLDYKPESKLYIGSPTGVKRLKTYQNNWSTMETTNMLRVNQADAMFHGFAFDNGVFADFKKGLQFNEDKYLIKLIELVQKRKFPDFIVVPDYIGEGLKSLQYSIDFMPKLLDIPFPKYLVVQNGMEIEDVEPYLDKNNNKHSIEFDGLFVGGVPTFKGFGQKQTDEVEWKLQTMEMWCELAHKYNKKCHIGRVSSIRRLNFARSIGADSYDTSIVNFSPKSFKQYEIHTKQQIMQF